MRRLKLDLIRSDPIENYRRSRMAMLTLVLNFLSQSHGGAAAPGGGAAPSAPSLDAVGEELVQKMQRMMERQLQDAMSSFGQIGQGASASPSFSAEQVRRLAGRPLPLRMLVRARALTAAAANRPFRQLCRPQRCSSVYMRQVETLRKVMQSSFEQIQSALEQGGR
jgi:hypothetical protein